MKIEKELDNSMSLAKVCKSVCVCVCVCVCVFQLVYMCVCGATK